MQVVDRNRRDKSKKSKLAQPMLWLKSFLYDYLVYFIPLIFFIVIFSDCDREVIGKNNDEHPVPDSIIERLTHSGSDEFINTLLREVVPLSSSDSVRKMLNYVKRKTSNGHNDILYVEKVLLRQDSTCRDTLVLKDLINSINQSVLSPDEAIRNLITASSIDAQCKNLNDHEYQDLARQAYQIAKSKKVSKYWYNAAILNYGISLYPQGDYNTIYSILNQMNLEHNTKKDSFLLTLNNSFLGNIQFKIGRKEASEKTLLKGIEISDKLGYVHNLISNYQNLAAHYYITDKKKKSAEYYYKVVDLYNKYRVPPDDNLGRIYTELCSKFFESRPISEAFTNISGAIKVYKELESYKKLGESYSTRGQIYLMLDIADSALNNFENGLKYIKKSGIKPNDWNIYSQIGYTESKLGNFASSSAAHAKAMELITQSDDKSLAPLGTMMKGISLYHEGKLQEAKKIILGSIEKIELNSYTKAPVKFTFALFILGKIEKELKNYQSAIAYSEKAYYAAIKENNLRVAIEAGKMIASIYYIQGNLAAENKYLRRMIEFQHEKEVMTNMLAFGRREAQHEYEIKLQKEELETVLEREKSLESQQKQYQYLIFSLFLALFSCLLFILLYRRSQKVEQLALKVENDMLEKENLVKLDRLRRRIFTNISHDFRTPLNLIIEPIKALNKETESIDIKRKYKSIIANSEVLLRLVNQMLEISTIQENKITMQFQEVEIHHILKENLLSYDSYLLDNNMILHARIPARGINLMTDKNSLLQIVNNVLSNAIKFNRIGGQLVFKFEIHASEYKITVSDQGFGMTEEEKNLLFKRFSKDSKKIDIELYEPGGLGLNIVNELVHILKGTVEIKSKVNKGTELKINIPFHEKQDKEQDIMYEDLTLDYKNEITETNGHLPIRKKQEKDDDENDETTILVVEDNIELNKFIRDFLVTKYHVIYAYNGVDAWELCKNELPDVVLTDVMMPKMDGIELTKKIANDPLTSHIPTIFISAIYDYKQKLFALKSGGIDYLSKPISMEILFLKLENILTLRDNQATKNKELYNENSLDLGNENLIASSSMEEKFFNDLMKVINENIANEGFNVESLAQKLFISRSQLYKKLKSTMKMTPSKLLMEVRMKKAKELLSNRVGKVSEIGQQVGYSNASHFSSVFHNYYGVPPSDILT